MQFTRVKNAYQTKEITLKNYFLHKNLNYPGYRLFLRAFKREQKLEVWVRPIGNSKFQLLVEYDFCSSSGIPGPKRNEGDRQIPEGIYHIRHFNPRSKFHLSLGINYPNQSDRLLGGTNPGSDIYIHGGCITTGCIPLTDDKIKELYILAVEARQAGQESIPVHIYPAQLSPAAFAQLCSSTDDQTLTSFWKNLQPLYQDFECSRILRPIEIDSKGEYYLEIISSSQAPA